VLSNIGSFTSIQWHPGEIDGGNVYPFKIRKEPKRNIRVWLQDGTEIWRTPRKLAATEPANAKLPKMMNYDFHFSLGKRHAQRSARRLRAARGE